MKRSTILFRLLCLLCLLPYVAQAIPNPWLDLTQEELAVRTGIVVQLPEDAEAAVYRLLPEMALAEVQFTWRGWKCVFRAAPGDELTDVTGLYYTWETQEDCTVGDSVGCVWTAEDVSVCLWYDGLRSCSFALLGPGAATADVRSAAEFIAAPLQEPDEGEPATENGTP